MKTLILLLFALPALAQSFGTGNAKRIQGRPVCTNAPSDTNVLGWSASSGCWMPLAAGGSTWTDDGTTVSAPAGRNVAMTNTLLGTPIATPTPDSTKTQWYVKTGGAWCQQTPGGVETCMGFASGVTSVGLVGTANQITVTGASPITGSGSWTLSFPVGGVTLPGTTTGTFSGNLTGNASGTSGSTTGNAATATALASSPTNCSAGNFPLGINASGTAQNCTALPTTITGTANQITASGSTGAITLSIPNNPTLPGTTTGTFSGALTGPTVTLNGGGTGLLTMLTGTAPANPASSNIRLYGSSSTGKLACLDSAGADCMPTLAIPATVVQTNQSNAYTTGTQDFGSAAHTMPAVRGIASAKPGTCTTGEEYFATDATAGVNKYYCTATNTWTQQSGSGSASSALKLVDGSANDALDVAADTSTITDQITVQNSNTTNHTVKVSATGSDTNINLQLVPKGNGTVTVPVTGMTSGAGVPAAFSVGTCATGNSFGVAMCITPLSTTSSAEILRLGTPDGNWAMSVFGGTWYIKSGIEFGATGSGSSGQIAIEHGNDGAVSLYNSGRVTWGPNTTVGSYDTGLARTSAGVLEVNNATALAFRDLKLRTINNGGWGAGTEGGCATNTDLVVDGTTNTKVTSSGSPFVAADAGGWIDITAGSGWTTGRYTVVSISGSTATLDRSPGAVSITGGTFILNRGKIVFTTGGTDDTLRACALKASAYGWQAAW